MSADTIILALILLVLISIRELLARKVTKMSDYTWSGRLLQFWRRLRGG